MTTYPNVIANLSMASMGAIMLLIIMALVYYVYKAFWNPLVCGDEMTVSVQLHLQSNQWNWKVTSAFFSAGMVTVVCAAGTWGVSLKGSQHRDQLCSMASVIFLSLGAARYKLNKNRPDVLVALIFAIIVFPLRIAELSLVLAGVYKFQMYFAGCVFLVLASMLSVVLDMRRTKPRPTTCTRDDYDPRELTISKETSTQDVYDFEERGDAIVDSRRNRPLTITNLDSNN